jgi:hypothetical protein
MQITVIFMDKKINVIAHAVHPDHFHKSSLLSLFDSQSHIAMTYLFGLLLAIWAADWSVILDDLCRKYNFTILTLIEKSLNFHVIHGISPSLSVLFYNVSYTDHVIHLLSCRSQFLCI